MSSLDYFNLRGIDPGVYVAATLPPWLMEELRSLPTTSDILDFGCGFGQNLLAMKKQGFLNVTGADLNPQALSHCRSVGLKAYDISDGFDGLKADGRRFEVILTTHVLEHIAKDQVISVLSALRGLLRANGRLLISVPNAQAYTGAYWAYEDFTHHTLYTAGSLLYILRAAGFGNIELLDRDAVAGSKPFRRLVRLALAGCYRWKYGFWKRALGSPTHIASPDVFTYEIKMKAICIAPEA